MKVEKAKISDAQRIHELINDYADKGEMLPRALSEIYENLRDFFVIRDKDKKLIGCVALHINWADIAEIKSLAVSEEEQAKGIGRLLVNACIDEAEELEIPTVFCLSYKPAFFEKYKFRRIDKMELPRKVWSECYRCPKFPDCDEVALIYQFGPAKS
ncbi:MAG TPA: N-acetyltransferase [Dehalococcoidia bacterium]|jgi:amino-acid N-acetyltransferase